MSAFTAAILLFMVMDPFGNIPFFLSALQRVPEPGRLRVAARELAFALLVLLFFLFFGRPVLDVLHISDPALTTGGGIILFLIALRMIFPSPHPGEEAAKEGEPFIVPLAIPYVAGPSSMATVMLIMGHDPSRWAVWLVSVLAAWLAVGAIIILAVRFAAFLKPKILLAVERLMGMVLVAIAVQMIMDGVRLFVESF
jgi:MarC family membrane protein